MHERATSERGIKTDLRLDSFGVSSTQRQPKLIYNITMPEQAAAAEPTPMIIDTPTIADLPPEEEGTLLFSHLSFETETAQYVTTTTSPLILPQTN